MERIGYDLSWFLQKEPYNYLKDVMQILTLPVGVFNLSIENDVSFHDACIWWINGESILGVATDDTVRNATI